MQDTKLKETTSSDRLAQAVGVFGARWDASILAATRALYAPHVARGGWEHTQVREDVAYGPDARHRLDIYGANLQGPAVLFVHGGGFVAGDKRNDDIFYANIGHHFAARGIQAVLMTYRLAPTHAWPAASDDVERAVTWAGERLGVGTRERPLVLIGQSAGACHVAGYLFRESSRAHAAAHLAGCVLMSGVYDAQGMRSPGAAAYFGADAAELAQRVPAAHVQQCDVPLLVTVSEFDIASVAAQGFGLARRLTEANGRSPEFRWFRGHNHVSPVHSLGTAQDDVALVLDDFVGRCVAR